ncbi:MAG: type II toxin-antitoxin system RelE/ParE family toxin [Opitutales bacterium]|nr:type II toxin-antitoxin system RelE/ParE family toxin [Opitutales bacterium]MCH8540707.1 type II toxin-antitoxin system RelE/ParE family toxin [Opitutales bacterium]
MLFIETPIFTKQASGGLFNDEELKQLQTELLKNPCKGDLITGSGGLRKIRLARKGRGKSGGFRVIYYRNTPEIIFLLLAYPKNKQENLTKAELKLLRELIED